MATGKTGFHRSLATLIVMSRCGALAASILFAGVVIPSAAFAASSEFPAHYTDAAKRLTDGALADPHSLDRLEYLCDHIGNRISGSPALDRAIAFAVEEMKRAGLEKVHTQAVKVPHWVRGSESAMMTAPLQRRLPMLGLGNSVGTPAGGLTSDVVVVANFDQLTALPPDQVRGKIVLFDAPYQGYGRTVQYRISGASRAAALGAVAVLVRSITPFSLRTPHTGTLVYTPGTQIPAAAITIEDAEAIHRLSDKGVRVTVQLKMEAHFDPDADSANVIGEITGSEKPDEIVVAGGHLDSWDVGQGAQDDGSGIMATLEAAALIQRLGLKPRRTIRVVFWVNEENGGAGGRAYKDALSEVALHNHVAALEMDGGAEKPIGFGLGEDGHPHPPGSADATPAAGGPPSKAIECLRQIGTLLTSIGANQIQNNGGGSDIEPLMAAGVPGIGELSSGAHYFDWHHTEADTFDKINPQEFRESVAAMSVMMYVLADMPERLSGLQ